MHLIRFGDDIINIGHVAGITPIRLPRAAQSGDESGDEIIGCRAYLVGGTEFNLDGPEAWQWFVDRANGVPISPGPDRVADRADGGRYSF
jgi:hypothetical protein